MKVKTDGFESFTICELLLLVAVVIVVVVVVISIPMTLLVSDNTCLCRCNGQVFPRVTSDFWFRFCPAL